MKIQRKLALGYTIIVALIGGIVYTYLHEWRQMNRLEREVKEIHRLRQNVHEAYVHMLDLTMFGETILEWEEADTALYRAKRMEVDSILCEFKNYYSGERIDSLRHLMAEKEIQLFNISQLFENRLNLAKNLPSVSPSSLMRVRRSPRRRKVVSWDSSRKRRRLRLNPQLPRNSTPSIVMSSGNSPSRAGNYPKRQIVWHSVISTSTNV